VHGLICISATLMPENTLDKFLVQSSTPRSKRPRSYTSPGSAEINTEKMTGAGVKVGDLSMEQLMAAMSSLLDQKNLATKEDLREVTSNVAALAEENKVLKDEITKLQRHEKAMLNKLVDLESRSRRNNLIFRGLKWTGARPI